MCTHDRWSRCALDGETGEVFQRRLTPDHREILEWLRGLPGPVAVTYEAGPTGFGLARALIAAGVSVWWRRRRSCSARPGIGSRPMPVMPRIWPGCCIWGEITEVTIPSVEQEAARDLVRAREDCRGDLMSARHRVSKLLLRQGIVYSGGKAWTGKHELWLRSHSLRHTRPAVGLRRGVRCHDVGRGPP